MLQSCESQMTDSLELRISYSWIKMVWENGVAECRSLIKNQSINQSLYIFVISRHLFIFTQSSWFLTYQISMPCPKLERWPTHIYCIYVPQFKLEFELQISKSTFAHNGSAEFLTFRRELILQAWYYCE